MDLIKKSRFPTLTASQNPVENSTAIDTNNNTSIPPLNEQTKENNEHSEPTSSNNVSIEGSNIEYGIQEVDQIELYQYNKTKAWSLYALFSIFTVGILPILSIWFIKIRIFLCYTKIEEPVS